jgi:hypothetical protein
MFQTYFKGYSFFYCGSYNSLYNLQRRLGGFLENLLDPSQIDENLGVKYARSIGNRPGSKWFHRFVPMAATSL